MSRCYKLRKCLHGGWARRVVTGSEVLGLSLLSNIHDAKLGWHVRTLCRRSQRDTEAQYIIYTHNSPGLRRVSVPSSVYCMIFSLCKDSDGKQQNAKCVNILCCCDILQDSTTVKAPEHPLC